MKQTRKRLIRADKAHLWHPFTQMRDWASEEPLIIERGRGSYLIDIDGRKYLDGVSSLWVTVHGHGKKEIDSAIKRQLGKIAHSTLLGLSNVPAIELAERLSAIAPRGLEKVFFSDNGSTAVEIALKMSFQYWQQSGKPAKKRFLAFTGAYHGDTFGSMSVGEIDIFVEKYRALLFRAFRAPYPYCYRCPVKKSHPDCELECLGRLEAILKRHSGEIAACIIEPVFEGASGMVTSPPGFFRAVRKLTKKYGVHLIADEVATGFGRTGALFACDREKVSPDFLCLAKGLTGGYMPLAATLTTKKIYNAFLGRYDEFKAFFHGHTYTGNPLGSAAALANLDIFEKERVIERLQPKIILLKELLSPFKDLPHVGDVRQAGLVGAIELVEDKETKRPFPARRRAAYDICMGARERGLIIRPLGDNIIIMPPLSITVKELKTMMKIIFEGVRGIRR